MEALIMKIWKMNLLLMAICTCSLAYSAPQHSKYKYGKDFTLTPNANLSQPIKSKTIEVVEFTNDNSPGSKQLEPSLQAWLKVKAKDVSFTRISVDLSSNKDANINEYTLTTIPTIVVDKRYKIELSKVNNDPVYMLQVVDFLINVERTAKTAPKVYGGPILKD
jgi:hypothetical protein